MEGTHRGGVEGLEVIGLFWPAKDGKWKEAGAEPGVQHIFVLLKEHLALGDTEQLGCLGAGSIFCSCNNPPGVVRWVVAIHASLWTKCEGEGGGRGITSCLVVAKYAGMR
jgi:hypothetical protein